METLLTVKIIIKNKICDVFKNYVYIKSILMYITNKYDVPKPIKNILIYTKILTILSMLVVIILEIILVICKFYQFIIHHILKLKLKSQYRGILEGTDSVFLLYETENSRVIISILLLVDFKGTGKDFCDTTRQEIIRVFSKKKLEKLLWTKHSFLGYYYYKFCDVDWDQFISEVDCDNLEKLNVYLNKLGTKELPMENTALWDVTIGKNVVEGRGYPLIFRFHHCIGDAVSIFNLFSTEFNKPLLVSPGYPVKATKKNIDLRPIDMKFLKDPFIMMFPIVEDPDKSLIFSKEISLNKYFVWHSERNSKYLAMIKGIKKKFGGEVTFMSVVLTALSSSLDNFAKNKTDQYPSNFTAIFTMLPLAPTAFVYGKEENYELNNKPTVGIVKLPLKIENTISRKDDLIQRFHSIISDYQTLKNKSLDFAFNRWQLEVFLKYIPNFIVKKYVNSMEVTCLISNIPGCAHLEFFGNSSVRDFVVFNPNLLSGISLMLTSYEGRLNFAFTFDRSIVANQKDAEWICRNMLDNIEQLHNI